MRLAILALSLLPAAGLVAQAKDDPTPACTYQRCALAIVPTWNGLALERLDREARVANLNFFWPRDIAPALRGGDERAWGADSAVAHARHALRLRRVGAALTDAGMLIAATAIMERARVGQARQRETLWAGVGFAAIAVSVPIQFAADGALSRAVWWHNARYQR